MASIKDQLIELKTTQTSWLYGIELEADVREMQPDGFVRKVTWDTGEKMYILWQAVPDGFERKGATLDIDRAVGWLNGGP